MADSATKKADLVLEGGGVKGIGLLGAVTVLGDAGFAFPRVAGTSAGAIVGALIAAAQATGRPVAGLRAVMEQLDYRRFRDETWLDKFGLPGKAIQLLTGEGVYKGEFLVEWLDAELQKLGVRTFADLKDDDPGSALPPQQRYKLVVHASDLSRGQLVRLPWDYHLYGMNPDEQLVVDAVRASMSIPFFFEPVTLKCAPEYGAVTLVDGGMLSNFPIEVFDRNDGQPARWPTYGIKLSAKPASVQVAHPADSTIKLALACLSTLLNAHDRYHLDDIGVTERTIFVDTLKVQATDFGIDAATQQTLFQNGQDAATAFLAKLAAPVPAQGQPAENPAPAAAG